MRENKNGILFIIFSLGNGGSERMMMNVLNKSKLHNHNKILYLYNNLNSNSYEFLLSSDVKIYKSDKTNKLLRHISRLKKLVAIIKNENVKSIVCFSSQATLMAVIIKKFFFFRKINVITRLGAFYIKQYSDSKSNRLKYFFWVYVTINISYRFSDRIICLTNSMKNDLVNRKSRLKDKIVIINNYIDRERILKPISSRSPIKYNNYIISVGRLGPQKNYPGLIKAFNIVKDEISEDLLILGDGSQKAELENLIKKLDCSERIFLLGFKKNPYKYLSNANFFILNSYYEGMSNSLLEAMMCKIPIIVSDHPGSEDVITNNENGLVVPMGDVSKLAYAILELSSNMKLRKQLVKSCENTISQFTNTIDKYSILINKWSR